MAKPPMTAQLIDGKQIAADIRKNIALQVQDRLNKGLRAPGLAVILVGSDPANAIWQSVLRQCRNAAVQED